MWSFFSRILFSIRVVRNTWCGLISVYPASSARKRRASRLFKWNSRSPISPHRESRWLLSLFIIFVWEAAGTAIYRWIWERSVIDRSEIVNKLLEGFPKLLYWKVLWAVGRIKWPIESFLCVFVCVILMDREPLGREKKTSFIDPVVNRSRPNWDWWRDSYSWTNCDFMAVARVLPL